MDIKTGNLLYFPRPFFRSNNTNHYPNFIFTLFLLQRRLENLRYIADGSFLWNSYNLWCNAKSCLVHCPGVYQPKFCKIFAVMYRKTVHWCEYFCSFLNRFSTKSADPDFVSALDGFAHTTNPTEAPWTW